MGTLMTPSVDHVILTNLRWATFKALLKDLGDDRGGRIAYDKGTLEIMSPSRRHERVKGLIGRFIETFTEELNVKLASMSSTTLTSQLKEKGVEPDECYYVQNEAAVRASDDLDLARDPPPDIAIEIDISRGSLNKWTIYAALGVPELWTHTGDKLEVYLLRKNGKYTRSKVSAAFPQLPIPDVARFLDKRDSLDETSLVRAFRAWVRERFQIS